VLKSYYKHDIVVHKSTYKLYWKIWTLMIKTLSGFQKILSVVRYSLKNYWQIKLKYKFYLNFI